MGLKLLAMEEKSEKYVGKQTNIINRSPLIVVLGYHGEAFVIKKKMQSCFNQS